MPGIKSSQQVDDIIFQCACEHHDINSEGESAPCGVSAICNTTIACYSYAKTENE